MIELLVVIAIIGILSAVVLGNLNQARAKSSDTAVKANLGTIATQAELFYDEGGYYNEDGATAIAETSASAGEVCGANTGMFGNANITNALAQVASQMDSTAEMTCTTDASGQKWAISVTKLRSAATEWCVDNSGWKKAGAADTDGTCVAP